MTAIVPSDIVFLLSVTTGSAGYTAASAPAGSIGKYASVTPVSATALDNVFSDITGAENAADQVDYRCLFILNNTATVNPMTGTVVWLPLSGGVSGGATLALATDNFGVTPKGQTGAQAAITANSLTAPTGVSSYVSPSLTNAGGLAVGSVAPGYCFAIWLRRTATSSAALLDGFSVEVDFTSAQ